MNNDEKLKMYYMEGVNDPIWVVLFYLLFAIYYSRKTFLTNKKHKAYLLNEYASNTIELQLFSNRLIFFSCVLIIVVPISLAVQYFDFDSELIHKTLFILFSFIPHFVLITILTLRNSADSKISRGKKGTSTSIEADNLEVLKSELTAFIVKNRPYLNQNLTLQILANLVNWNRSDLSIIINKGFGKNFYDFVNEYRLKAAMERLHVGAYKEYSLDHIVGECGFKNYVSFYRIFKRINKKSPKEYINGMKGV